MDNDARPGGAPGTPRRLERKARILIPTAVAGGGHTSPATAVRDALEELYPGRQEVEIVDLATRVGAEAANAIIQDQWNRLLAHPGYTKFGWWIIHNFLRGLPFWDEVVGLRDFEHRTWRYLREIRPDYVFSTYHVTAIVCGILRRRGLLKSEVSFFATDPFVSNFMWDRAARLCDDGFVASRDVRRSMVLSGADGSRIHRVDYPVRLQFTAAIDARERVRRELGLVEGLPTVLMSVGGEGIGHIAKHLEAILRERYPANLVVVCGRSEAMRRRMTFLAREAQSPTRIVVLGYAGNMHELLQACDVSMGKAGASTVMESLNCGRPIIFTAWAAHHELANIQYCVNRGYGWYAHSVKSQLRILRSLMGSDTLTDASRRIRAAKFRTGAREIARFIGGRLGLDRS